MIKSIDWYSVGLATITATTWFILIATGYLLWLN